MCNYLEILSGESQAAWQLSIFRHNIVRHQLTTVAYLLCGYDGLSALPKFHPRKLAEKIFGRDHLCAVSEQILQELTTWGWGRTKLDESLPKLLSFVLLANRSPYLEDLSTEKLRQIYERGVPQKLKPHLVAASRALAALGMISAPLPGVRKATYFRGMKTGFVDDCPPQWAEWCLRWYETSTLGETTRKQHYGLLLQAGRWLARTPPGVVQPGVVSPEDWDRALAAQYVAAVDRLTVGEWCDAGRLASERVGQPLSAQYKAGHLRTMSIFFRDCQEWGWIPRRFDPSRVFGLPRSISSKINRDPRVIKDDVWAKLMWAGLNLVLEDLAPSSDSGKSKGSWSYPFEMFRALTMVLLFAGLRADEIRRLRVGCVRWQREEVPVHGTGETLAKDAICWLDVPVNKTAPAFTKPVDGMIGEAVEAWEQVRPRQPLAVDSKTGESVHFLFSYRGDRLGSCYLNDRVMPLLCREAGVPGSDSRGRFTVHRARATIASQLYNAKEPIDLFDLQEWMGHSSPASTQHYVKIAPTKLAKSYSDADYFRRNLRMIEVLVDGEAVRSGAASGGEPWKFYDLGHGYCSYDFYAECPHLMACARCSFYAPKGSSKAQILESKVNLSKMLEEIPLTDEEVAAVEEGVELHEKLLERLADVPTPAGPTPRELGTYPLTDEINNNGNGSSASQGTPLIPLESLRRKPHTENGQQ